MGIVLGANIGTTVSSQILALDISKYSPIFLVIGFMMLFLANAHVLFNVIGVLLFVWTIPIFEKLFNYLKEIIKKGLIINRLIINPSPVKKKNFFN